MPDKNLKKLECDMFAGENAEALNALMSALVRASKKKANTDVYCYLEETPRTSFIVELHDALTELGYQIKPL